ncbi:MAG TPA: hypothetical protein VHL31_25355 [Geminicoccus sp.]|jgi:hypothetical protein|uniref:hypothetical protein n=1 Tax=Geminicoccus sp. TaxID=2024832 RepID=UPI002E325361|nr:hypothetical protein [Geminicoccus sp.]HEX2529609.1 hypothetical protein [Geminicoccus sp.]
MLLPMARAPRDRRLENRTARAELKPRKEPYWSKISPGCLIGYYRARSTPTGTWFAKFRPVGAKGITYKAEKLGAADDVVDANGRDILSWVQANEKARPWFEMEKLLAAGDGAKPLTIDQAIVNYLEDLKARGGSERYARSILRNHIPDALRHRKVMTLTGADFNNFRNNLVRLGDNPERVRASRASANRIMTILRAALNLARRQRPADLPSDATWRTGLKAFQNVTGSRNTFLYADEIRRLLDNINDPHLYDLVFALASCGARYGEMAACRVEDAHLHATEGARLHLPKGKTGPRTIAINDELRLLLTRLISGRSGS